MKTCFKCNQAKLLSEYYKHNGMADGHLNKCKECTKKDADENFKKKMLDPKWVVKERKRQREKEERKRNQGLLKKYVKKKIYIPVANRIFSAAIKSGKIKKMPCVICGKQKAQGHHEDYSKPLDIVWLCIRHHQDRHINLRNSLTLGEEKMPIDDFINKLKTINFCTQE